MSTGLIALLDDIAALSKMAAASLDDVASQAVKAGGKAAGIVIDDTAVTPRYVVGLAADRELPIIRKIAMGSLRNKMLFLLPGALGLSMFAPWAITPLLMAGGVYLCLEGFHKVFGDHEAEDPQAEIAAGTLPKEIEDARVASAIRTDFILSAEILAITLAGAEGSPVWKQGVILGIVGIGMTALVYGLVGLIVKADDAGLAMAQSASAAGWIRGLGRGIVSGMPRFLRALSLIGTLAMLWVGGGIVIHGLHQLGVHEPERWMHGVTEAVGATGFLAWLIEATFSGIAGLILGGFADRTVRRLQTK
jgi:uncharacterized protein